MCIMHASFHFTFNNTPSSRKSNFLPLSSPSFLNLNSGTNSKDKINARRVVLIHRPIGHGPITLSCCATSRCHNDFKQLFLIINTFQSQFRFKELNDNNGLFFLLFGQKRDFIFIYFNGSKNIFWTDIKHLYLLISRINLMINFNIIFLYRYYFYSPMILTRTCFLLLPSNSP